MVFLSSLLVAAALTAAPGETMLLDFSADWCEHCRTMAPTVARLEKDGYPVQHVDIDRQRPLAQQMGVTGVPCYVLISRGKEVDRVTGATSYERLTRMFASAAGEGGGPSAAPGGAVRNAGAANGDPFARQRSSAESTSPQANLPANPLASTPAAQLAAAGEARTVAASLGGQEPPSEAARRAYAATVRLRVDEANSQAFGTGTIVDVHGEEALVVTCAHIFRDSKGKGPITVDMFHPAAKESVTGHLLDYDLERDVALVSIRPGIAVQPVQVAAANFAGQKGDAVFSIGCDKGGPASVKTSYVTAINKYLGPPNIEVKGAPVDGRSGGGLFTADGRLIGVCNAAERKDDEGLYAAAAAIQSLLDKSNLSFVYQRATPNLAGLTAPPVAPGTTAGPQSGGGAPAVSSAGAAAMPPAAGQSAAPPRMPQRMPVENNPLVATSSTGPGASIAPAMAMPGPATPPAALGASGGGNEAIAAQLLASRGTSREGGEMICVVRSSDPKQEARVIVVTQPSAELLERLARESQLAAAGEPTALRAEAAGAAGTNSPVSAAALGGASNSASGRSPVLRGQAGVR